MADFTQDTGIVDNYLGDRSLFHHAHGEGFSSLQDLVINRAENKLDSSQVTELEALLANDNAITTVNEVIAALEKPVTFNLIMDYNMDPLNQFTVDDKVKKFFVLSVIAGNLDTKIINASYGHTMTDTKFSPTEQLLEYPNIDSTKGNKSIAVDIWDELSGYYNTDDN